jgi:hypothetical protein
MATMFSTVQGGERNTHPEEGALDASARSTSLVCNAGILRDKTANTSEEDWDKVVQGAPEGDLLLRPAGLSDT